MELEIERYQIDIDSRVAKLDRYESNKSKLEENQKIDQQIVILKTQIDTMSANINQANVNIERHRGNIVSMNDKIKVNLDLIKKIKTEEELIATFKIYLSIFGKNGISKVIMKNMIPVNISWKKQFMNTNPAKRPKILFLNEFLLPLTN